MLHMPRFEISHWIQLSQNLKDILNYQFINITLAIWDKWETILAHHHHISPHPFLQPTSCLKCEFRKDHFIYGKLSPTLFEAVNWCTLGKLQDLVGKINKTKP